MEMEPQVVREEAVYWGGGKGISIVSYNMLCNVFLSEVTNLTIISYCMRGITDLKKGYNSEENPPLTRSKVSPALAKMSKQLSTSCF